MDNKLALEVLMLLSALESWSMSFEQAMPIYMVDSMQHVVSELTKQILKGEINEYSDNDTGIDGSSKRDIPGKIH